MREILFRGKCQTGEWVGGGFLDRKGKPEIIDFDRGEEGDFTFNTKVDSKTVGQFTGLTDKNGVKIFEGDIFNLGDKDILYIVVWSDTGFRGRQTRSTSYVGLEYWKDKIEVSGNIYDNPELLEAK